MPTKHASSNLAWHEHFYAHWFAYLYCSGAGMIIGYQMYHHYHQTLSDPWLKACEIGLVGCLIALGIYLAGWTGWFIISHVYYILSWPFRSLVHYSRYQVAAPLIPTKHQVGRYQLSDAQITCTDVSFLDTPADVWASFLEMRFDINHLVVAHATPFSRETAAYYDLNAGLLREHKRIIRQRIVQRNDYDRKRAMVPGWRQAAKDEHLFHRTHLIPFRYVLSEGYDIPGLLFTGTAQLNSGDRPEKGYLVRNTGFLNHQKRQKILLKYFQRHHGRPLESASIKELAPVSAMFSDNDFIFSLDDFERLSDYYIEQSPTHNFRYGAFTDANFDSLQVIPESLSVYLYDMTAKKFCFQATLPNVH